MSDVELELNKKYTNREGHTVQIIKYEEDSGSGLVFTIKSLRSGIQYQVNKKGRYQSGTTDHPKDVVGVYIMTPTQNHLTILRLIKAMGSTIHEGKFIDRLMKESNAPPSLHQAESRINDLLNGGMLIIKPGTKLKIYELTDKALAFLK